MSKEEAIIKLVQAFRQYGYEGATLSLLSQTSGLGKASLYHYFPGGKSEMAAVVSEYVSECFENMVLKTLQGEGSPESKIQAMCSSMTDFYNSGKNACFLAIMSFGEADKLFHDRVKARLQKLIQTLAQVLTEAGIESEIAQKRSLDAVATVQGALILVRILDSTEPFDQAIESIPARLLD